jgi:hypothetical protein
MIIQTPKSPQKKKKKTLVKRDKNSYKTINKKKIKEVDRIITENDSQVTTNKTIKKPF